MEIVNFLNENLYILIPVMYFVGEFLKSVEVISNRLIPVLVMVISILLTYLISRDVTIAITEGIIIAGLTVFVNENIKQFFKK